MDSFTERFKRSTKDTSKHTKSNKVSTGHTTEKNDTKMQGNDFFDHVYNGPSMVMKCVIVAKDAKGYGLTVSGDNPVYVQSVKEDGAAAKAGVVQGDRILKVNGEKVTDRNHTEVVKLIKADNYVALTLLGPPPFTLSESSDVGSTSSLSNPSEPAAAKQKASIYDEKILTLKVSLDQEKAEFEKIKVEYSKNPDMKLLKDLVQAQKVKEDLEKQLWKMENSRNNLKQNSLLANTSTNPFETVANTSTNPFEMDDSPPQFDSVVSEEPLVVMEDSSDVADSSKKFHATDAPTQSKYNKDLLQTSNSDFIPENNSSVMVVEDTMDLFKDYSASNPFLNTALMNSENGKLCNQQNNQIMNFEDDDDIVAQCDVDHGPFNDFDSLRQKPAHLAVFFNYVIGSKESAEFLFTLAVDNFKQSSNTKDMLKLGDSINKSYITSSAPFKIEVEHGVSQFIQSLLSSKNPAEDALRRVFDGPVQNANKKIRSQLAVYRMKREQGLGSLFGDEKLQHAPTVEQTEIRIVDEIIMPTLSEWLTKKSSDDVEQARIVIIQDALQAFLNQYGTKRVKKATSRIVSMLKPKPARIISGPDQVSDDQNNRKSIGGIFTVKRGKRHDVSTADKSKPSSSKRDKSSRPYSHVLSSEPMKPTKVGPSVDAPSLSSLNAASQDLDERNLAHLKRADKSFESLHNPNPAARETPISRSKNTLPDDWLSRGRAHTVTITPTPPLNQPVLNESNLISNDDIGAIFSDTPDTTAAERRRRRDDESRLSLGSTKSNSDPEKSKINQVLGISNEQAEQTFRHHTLSTTESTLSLNIEDRKAFDNLPNFADDPEIDIDETVQQWTDLVPESVTKSLEKKEVRRQQIINELMLTEKHHVRDLKILEKMFYDRLISEDILTNEERQSWFPNLIEILNLHRDLNQALMAVKERDGHVVKEIGDILLSRFDGDGGNTFKNECARYCGNQTSLLSAIKEKTKKDQNFKQFLHVAQKHPVCRRFHLKDFIPLEFQRLTKYPLLLENIVKYTKERKKGKHDMDAEVEKVRKACEQCREILAFANQTIKEAEDKQKIIEIQQNLDREPITKLRNPSKVIREFANIDLVSRQALYQGTLTWRMALAEKRKEIPVHCILYDDVFVLLQKQEDRYVLKCQGPQSDKSTGGSHAPFIKIDNKLIVRNVATDKRAFFAMPMTDSTPQMYEFVATSANEMKQWMKLIAETAKNRVGIISPSRATAFAGSAADEPAGTLIRRAEDGATPGQVVIPRLVEYSPGETSVSSGNLPNTTAILSQLSLKDQEIKEAIAVKFKLLAELLGLDESEVESILEISAMDSNPDPNMLISHSILCVDKLTGLLNESAIPKASFAKSRHQSQADAQSLNHLSAEEAETASQSDSAETSTQEKWAEPAPHSALDEAEAEPDKTGNDVKEPADEGSSTNAEDLSLENLETSDADDSKKESPERQRSASESSESTLENEEAPLVEATDSPEQAAGIEQPFANEKTLDVQSEAIGESSENLGNDSSTESPAQIESASIDDSVVESPESTAQTEVPSNTDANETEADLSQSTAVSDDASDHTKSRPLSEVEICSQNSDVPISKLMEIALLLQTQLTQLMQTTEEKETEIRQLRLENKKLKEDLENRKNSPNSSFLPSYEEAVNEDRRIPFPMTSLGSLAQGTAVVRASLLRHSESVSTVQLVATQSTEF